MVLGELSIRRRHLLEEIAAALPSPPPAGCVRVGVDGVSGSGKTTFAAQLAALLAGQGRHVVHVSADGFHHIRGVRYRRGRDSAEGFWLDSYDYPALRANVLDAFAVGGSRTFRQAVHDVTKEEVLEVAWQVAPQGAVLIVDGLFLHRDELAGVWDFSVFLHVPFEITAARMAVRDGSHPDPQHPSMRRYVGGERLYFAACSPWRRADVVIDNQDLDAPSIIDADHAMTPQAGGRT